MRSTAIILGLCLALAADASQLQYIKRNARLCDDNDDFCMNGTISYRANPRLIEVRGRVQRAPGPGLLQIRLLGANRQNHVRRALVEIRLRGRNSEIVRHQMIADAPDVYRWTFDSMTYRPDER